MGDGKSCLVLLLSLRLQGLKGAGPSRIIPRRHSSPNQAPTNGDAHSSPRALLVSLWPVALGSDSFAHSNNCQLARILIISTYFSRSFLFYKSLFFSIKYISDCHSRVILPPKGLLAMSENVFVCCNGA